MIRLVVSTKLESSIMVDCHVRIRSTSRGKAKAKTKNLGTTNNYNTKSLRYVEERFLTLFFWFCGATLQTCRCSLQLAF